MNNARFILDDVSVGYRRHCVASGLSAQLHSGELVCLTGRNGTGKSTLLRTMTGVLPPVAGKVTLDGKDITSLTPHERAKSIGVVLTDRIDVDGLSVFDLVAMGRAPYTGFFGRISSDDEHIVMESLQMVGMEDFVQRGVATLSDGERQKVMTAKALAQQTPVILLDEPTAFLDYPSKIEMFDLLLQLCHERQKAILISTHDLDVAMRKADTMWIMRRGEPLVTAPPSDPRCKCVF